MTPAAAAFVDHFMAENGDEPRSLGSGGRVVRARFESGEQCLLDEVFGMMFVADEQERIPKESVAVEVEPLLRDGS